MWNLFNFVCIYIVVEVLVLLGFQTFKSYVDDDCKSEEGVEEDDFVSILAC